MTTITWGVIVVGINSEIIPMNLEVVMEVILDFIASFGSNYHT